MYCILAHTLCICVFKGEKKKKSNRGLALFLKRVPCFIIFFFNKKLLICLNVFNHKLQPQTFFEALCQLQWKFCVPSGEKPSFTSQHSSLGILSFLNPPTPTHKHPPSLLHESACPGSTCGIWAWRFPGCRWVFFLLLFYTLQLLWVFWEDGTSLSNTLTAHFLLSHLRWISCHKFWIMELVLKVLSV